ncbi:hypothetical protein FCR2A7T_18390 [Flavobacterium cauense R2A-7]|nr:hypothetical protein FCR2A7T_18390 [Flavobacterium cauense R2A-7]
MNKKYEIMNIKTIPKINLKIFISLHNYKQSRKYKIKKASQN